LLALEKSKAVGRIIIRNKLGGIEGYGTGFMISPQIMITNAHVFPNEKIAAISEIEFNYQLDLSGKTSKSVVFSIKPNLLFGTSPEDKLDYTIVGVSAKSTAGKSITPFGYLPVSMQSPVFGMGQAVSIVQHPNGERKQMALRNNHITKIDLPYIIYTTDTLGGSSGSPIFNNDWEVGGLHHSGVPELNSKGQVMSVDGKVWVDWMGDQKVNWIANEGINMVDIIADIQKKKWTKKQKTMLKEVIE
jgi:V8-like Glu-specific endopeptidase